MTTEADDVEFEGTIEAHSSKAILFQAGEWDKGEWIPRSQCTIVEHPGEEKTFTVYIRRWLCKKNGWVEE